MFLIFGANGRAMAQDYNNMPPWVQSFSFNFEFSDSSTGLNHDGSKVNLSEKKLRSLGLNPAQYEGDYKYTRNEASLGYVLGLPYALNFLAEVKYAQSEAKSSIKFTGDASTDVDRAELLDSGKAQGLSEASTTFKFRPFFNRVAHFYMSLGYHYQPSAKNYDKIGETEINDSSSFVKFESELRIFNSSYPFFAGFRFSSLNYQTASVKLADSTNVDQSRAVEYRFRANLAYNPVGYLIETGIERFSSKGGNLGGVSVDDGKNRYDFYVRYLDGNTENFISGKDSYPFNWGILIGRTILGSNTEVRTFLNLALYTAF